MPSLPPMPRLQMQVSLRFLLLATAIIALFFGLRRSYLMTAFDLEEAIERARNIPIILTLVAAILTAVFSTSNSTSAWSAAVRGVALGTAVSFLSCLALAIEFGEMLRVMNYWNWWVDWIWVAPHLIIATVQGGALGAFVLQAGLLLQYHRGKRKSAHVGRNANIVKSALARRRRPL